MDRIQLIGTGFAVGSIISLIYLWWEFQNVPLVDDEDEDYEEWNGR